MSIDPSMSRFLVEVSCVAAAPSSSDSGFCMHTLVALAAALRHIFILLVVPISRFGCGRRAGARAGQPACQLGASFSDFRWRYERRQP